MEGTGAGEKRNIKTSEWRKAIKRRRLLSSSSKQIIDAAIFFSLLLLLFLFSFSLLLGFVLDIQLEKYDSSTKRIFFPTIFLLLLFYFSELRKYCYLGSDWINRCVPADPIAGILL